LLRSLCLGEMAHELERITEEAGRDGWGHEQYLRSLCDVEISRRAQRRQQRLAGDNYISARTTITLPHERKVL
jgi:hypothetical protein